ncbi:unnamed protein product [Blepharisma stoltei]|uniref:Tr-type G domain-containing protein n=1 Tax=Blepharisma stoltei TaxID=1481888 RepID=A0AAU9IA96_9CILI|nr:unnamed protein product [Blepharisma stoltei]
MLNNLRQKFLRNIAVIAHVDHGKTTLVDSILQQCGKKVSMDNLALEKERGITILSKVTGITYRDHLINFVDTPGHADFGGQVERVMSIVDGVLLVVCATEGPMPQTRYVLSKAIHAGLKPIVVMNKLDRTTSRPGEVESKIFDLFCTLNVNESQLSYPLLYASGRAGWADLTLNGPRKNCFPLLDTVISEIPPPKENEEGPFKMLVSMTETNPFFGTFMIGKVNQGDVLIGDDIHAIGPNGVKEIGKVSKIQKIIGMDRIDIEKGIAGDIISVAGVKGSVNDTISHTSITEKLDFIPIDSPTVTLRIRQNDSPFSGAEASKYTLAALKKRLVEEAENDLALVVKDGKNCIEVSGRGELHLGILIEQLRREDYEMCVDPPIIVTKEDESGNILEPIEEVKIECPTEYANPLTEAFLSRLANFIDQEEFSTTHTRLIFTIPTRAMMGFKPTLLNLTKGNITIESHVASYGPYKGALQRRSEGVVVATHIATCTEFGVNHLEEKGTSFVHPGVRVYEGMIIGETVIDEELLINPGKEKRFTNVRAAMRDDNIKLTPPREFTVEEAFAYINEDELVEITPKSIRMRKKILNSDARLREKKDKKLQENK